MSRSRDPLATSRPRDPLALAVPLLVVLYVAGAVWATADAITPIGSALLDGSVLNAPLMIVAAQVLGALGLLRASGAVRIAAGALIGLACTASLAAFLADGDLAHAGLTAPQVAFQCLIGATTAVTLASLAARGLAARRRVTAAA